MSTVGPVAQQGVISTQVEHIQNDRPASAEQARPVEKSPPPPPPETGRGQSLDTSA